MSVLERLGSEMCPPPWRLGAPAEYRELVELLASVRFRPGWGFELITYGSETVLAVELETVDTYADPPRPVVIGHKFPVPGPRWSVANWPRRNWRMWLLDRIADVDRHEASEWFLERVTWSASVGGRRDVHEEWVRPFDPHRDPMQSAYRTVDWLGDASPR